jgi:hypothetical protein
MRINRNLLAAAAFGGLAVTALAQSATPAGDTRAGKTRAEVRVEAIAALAAGQVRSSDREPYLQWDSFPSTRSRVEVRAEAVEALRLGLVSYGDIAVREASPVELELIRQAGSRARTGETCLAGN